MSDAKPGDKPKTKVFGMYGVFLYVVALILAVGLSYGLILVNIASQDNPLILAVSSFVLLVILRSSMFRVLNTSLPELTLEAIVVIVLTLVFIQVSYPFFSPRVEIISSSIVRGYADDSGDYVYEVISATVRKPIFMVLGGVFGEYCTDISFVRNIEGVIKTSDVSFVTAENGTRVCASGKFDIVTRLIQFNADLPSPLAYSIGESSLLLASDSNASSDTQYYTVDAVNKMVFPVVVKKTVQLKITDETWTPSNEQGVKASTLYDKIITNYVKNGCSNYELKDLIESSFRISDSKTPETGNFGGHVSSVSIDKDLRMITLEANIYAVLEPGVKNKYYALYKPVRCLQDSESDVKVVQTTPDKADVVINT